jgi:hypothetical protein
MIVVIPYLLAERDTPALIDVKRIPLHEGINREPTARDCNQVEKTWRQISRHFLAYCSLHKSPNSRLGD